MNRFSSLSLMAPSLAILALALVAGCDIINPPETIPAYVRIEAIDFTNDGEFGFPSSKFSDAWVFVDDDPVGIFELPAVFPVFATGNVTIKVGGGIKENGFSTVRLLYPLTNLFEEDVNLQELDTVVIEPRIEFTEGIEKAMVERFETGNDFEMTALSDGTFETIGGSNVFEGSQSALIELQDDSTGFRVRSINLALPAEGIPVFLEMDYKCNQIFDVWLTAQTSGLPASTYMVTVAPQDDWNKIYICLTETIALFPDAFSYQIEFLADRDNELDEPSRIFLDNIKVLHL